MPGPSQPRPSTFLRIAALVLALLAAPPPTSAQPAPDPPVSPPGVAAVDALMREAHRRGVLNGNVLVAEGGAVVYEAQHGYAAGGRTTRLAAQHRFNVGSISKEFSAAGLMLLVEAGRALYRTLKAAAQDEVDFSDEEDDLADTGHYLLRKGRTADAVGVFEWAAEQFPSSASAHGDLGEVYLAAGDPARAAQSFRRALALDPGNVRLRALLDRLAP